MKEMLGSKIGEGGCSEVFEWGDSHTVIKIGKSNVSFDALRREFHNHQIAWENGLPVPKPIMLVELDDRPGFVLERIYGESLMERMMKTLLQQGHSNHLPEVPTYEPVKVTASLLSDIHKRSNLSMPPQREMMKDAIHSARYLSMSEKEKVIRGLERLPLKQLLCHGDPNPNNIMVCENKPIFIDWMNASIGNPEADLAEYIIMIRFAILPAEVPIEAVHFFDSVRETLIQVFCDEYYRLSGIAYEDVEDWFVPVAARKLCADGISEEEKDLLIRYIRARL